MSLFTSEPVLSATRVALSFLSALIHGLGSDANVEAVMALGPIPQAADQLAVATPLAVAMCAPGCSAVRSQCFNV